MLVDIESQITVLVTMIIKIILIFTLDNILYI